MTSKTTLDSLIKYLPEDEVESIKRDLCVLDVFRRMVTDDTNFVDPEFSNGTKLYVDGPTKYASAEEKEIVSAWLDEVISMQV